MPHEKQILAELPKVIGDIVKLPGKAEPRPCKPTNGADLCVRLGPHILAFEVKSSSRVAHINQAIEALTRSRASLASGAIPVVAVPFMGEAGRQLCQERGVSFVDLSGNAHIEAPGLLIHVEGRPNKYVEKGRPASPFAPKSSRLARVLLRDPGHWWSQQGLANETQLGPGFISRLVKRLQEDGLVERDKRNQVRPSDPNLLLDAWRNDYRFERHDSLVGHVSSRTGDELSSKVAHALGQSRISYALTGLSGAALLAPFAAHRRVTVFVGEQLKAGVLERLKFHAEEKGANLWLVVPRDSSVFWDAKEIDGIRCASAIQVYLDLKSMPERAEEAAEQLRSKYLSWSSNG